LLVLSAVAVAGSACGGEKAGVAAAPPQIIRVGTSELDGSGGVGFRLDVRRLQITPSGWRVHAKVTNATPTRWTIGRPHTSDGAKFGLFVAQTARELRASRLEASGRTTPPLVANAFDPPLPRSLAPGASWSGSFAGTGQVPAGSFLSVAFGRFSSASPPRRFPAGLLAVTSVPIRVR
jgi:hypothetical protein